MKSIIKIVEERDLIELKEMKRQAEFDIVMIKDWLVLVKQELSKKRKPKEAKKK